MKKEPGSGNKESKELASVAFQKKKATRMKEVFQKPSNKNVPLGISVKQVAKNMQTKATLIYQFQGDNNFV